VTSVAVKPIPSDLYPSPTRRPAYSVLRCCALELTGRGKLPPWEEALAEFLQTRLP
jgi:dTDP-4-dehydrorhamnose reductase